MCESEGESEFGCEGAESEGIGMMQSTCGQLYHWIVGKLFVQLIRVKCPYMVAPQHCK